MYKIMRPASLWEYDPIMYRTIVGPFKRYL